MAIVHRNIVTEGFRGKIGNLIFRKRGNKTTAYVMSPKKAPLTEKQKEAQKRFAMAVALAKQALTDESGKKRFEDMAHQLGKESAYSAAVSYFMNHEE
jgi:hypothetical protein